MDASFEARNTAETAFFSKGAYQSLPQNVKGIASLRVRLSHLLYRHLKQELPKPHVELNEKHEATEKALADLGEKRATFAEQKRFLIATSAAYQSILPPLMDTTRMSSSSIPTRMRVSTTARTYAVSAQPCST